MNKQSSKALHDALSSALKAGVEKYGARLLLSFSDRNRLAEERKAA
jgi:hypothetical protein